MDAAKNFAKVTVSTGYDASAISIALTSGHGAKLPAPATDGAFNLTWWNATDYNDPSDDPNVEIVRCTARSTDTLTVTRAQEGTSASTKNTSAKTYKMALTYSKKVFDDMNTLLAPQGFLLNGQISRTVASNNITVAIKTLAGSDPTVNDPVKVRIGNTVRTITAALSVTKNAATNWFNAGSSELATKEIDYFAYLGYNATDGVTIGFARIPYGRIYSDFSATTTNQDYCAISTITNAASTDEYELIGRFNATLSAGAGYTWSVPATSIIINKPIFYTRWLSWQPTYGGTGSMTYSSVSTTEARYKIIHDSATLTILASGTTGGTPSVRVTFTVPIAKTDGTSSSGGGANVIDGGIYLGGLWTPESTTTIGVGRYDGANWGASSGDQIACTPTYRIR